MKKLSPKKKLAKECYDLWVKYVKERSGWKSELSGQPGVIGKSGKITGLNAHHIAGKSNYWLRFEPDNGINLSSYEHIHGVHSHDPLVSHSFMNRIIKLIGQERWDKLQALRHKPGQPDLYEVKERLEKLISKSS